MTIPEILKELEPYTGKFPMKAVKAAVEQRDAITPELLGVLETVAENPAEWAKREDYMLHVFAIYLLAQFRETRAYPLLVKIVSAPGEIPFDLFGDTVTEGLKQVLASVYDGDPGPLRGLVESEQVNEYVRDAGINAFLVLARTGLMAHNEVVGYFRSLFHGRLERRPSYAWSSLVCAVADLPAPELLEEVRQAYANDLVDEGVAHLEGIELDILAGKPPRRDDQGLITDAIKEMEWWAAFHLEDSPSARLSAPVFSPPELPTAAPTTNLAAQPFVRGPKVGRNDPCPCGSGKKFKKCCGAA